MTATSEQIEYGRKHNKWKLESESLLGECIMEPLTKEEMKIAESFCNKEKNLFWLCMYQIARNKRNLPFMRL